MKKAFSVLREDLFITSKVWNTFHHPDSVRKACETTLKNLRLKYLDLYLIHWPMSYKEDGDKMFPLDANEQYLDGGVDYLDCWKGMEALVGLGLVKSIGVSNFNSRQIDRVVANGNKIAETCRWREVPTSLENNSSFIRLFQRKSFR